MYRLAFICVLLASPALSQDRDRDRDRGRQGDEIDRLARRLERDSRELREEVLSHFRNHGSYKELEKHAREIERQAGRVHKLTDVKARPKQVREGLDNIDEEVRHIDRHLREMARDKEIDRRAYDRLRDEVTDIGRTLYRLRKELP